METIKAKETRNLFLTKNGMPKKNILMTLEEICENLGKPLPQDKIERFYVRAINTSCVRDTRKYFHEHHIMFIAPRINGAVYYGFSTNQKLLDNYSERLSKKTKSHALIERQAKSIMSGQLEFFEDTQQKLIQ
jgi:hypothetical protein